VAALPGIIGSLQRRGYRLVTVPDLLGLRSTYG
jgi:biotin operon repressor